MKYTVHIQSIEIDEEERDRVRKIGFHEWFCEQAELKNIQYDYIEKVDCMNDNLMINMRIA